MNFFNHQNGSSIFNYFSIRYSSSNSKAHNNHFSYQNSKKNKMQTRGYDRYERDYYDDYDDYDYDYDDDYYDENDRYYDRQQQYRGEQEQAPPAKKGKKGSTALAILGVFIRMIIIIGLVALLILPEFMPEYKPYRDTFFDYILAGMFKYQEVPDTVEFSVERTFTIDSTGELNYTLYIPTPQNLKIDDYEAQELRTVEFLPKFSEKRTGEDDQWVWHGYMAHGGEQEIKIVYHFRTAKIKWDISIGKSGTIDDIDPRYINRWGGNQWPVADYNDAVDFDSDSDGIMDEEDVDDDNIGGPDKYRIEPGNSEIRSLLIDILVDYELIEGGQYSQMPDLSHLNVYEVVKAIYTEIHGECEYPTEQQAYDDARNYGSYPKWATGTWDDKRGDCDDQSILFISLCRAAGIPAMLEIGALYDPQMDQWEGHGWANVFIPYSDEYSEEKGVDHITPMVDIVNNIFLFRDPNRFSEWVDDGKRGNINPETLEWEYSNLEKRYLAWEYTRANSNVDVDFAEEYVTLEFKAYPPEQKVYI